MALTALLSKAQTEAIGIAGGSQWAQWRRGETRKSFCDSRQQQGTLHVSFQVMEYGAHSNSSNIGFARDFGNVSASKQLSTHSRSNVPRCPAVLGSSGAHHSSSMLTSGDGAAATPEAQHTRQ